MHERGWQREREGGRLEPKNLWANFRDRELPSKYGQKIMESDKIINSNDFQLLLEYSLGVFFRTSTNSYLSHFGTGFTGISIQNGILIWICFLQN